MSNLLALKQSAKELSILYVEDERDLRNSVATYLKKIFDQVFVAVDGQDGLEQYKEHKPDIVITDILMPNLNGIEMLKAIKNLHPKQAVIITSAYTESEFFLESIKLGVSSYIIKPINYDQMVEVLSNIVHAINQEKELNLYHSSLESIIENKVKEYQHLEHQRVEDYEKVLLALVKMIEERDSYTAGHSQRVAKYSQLLAEAMGYDEEACETLYKAGILHDIGKIATPDAILLKPEKLTAIEYKLIKEHVKVGVNILKEIPMFEQIIEIIQCHHERCDGTGYPLGLKGDEIPPLARIMIVADAFDAMTTSRIYRHKKSVQDALLEISSLSRIQFHPEVAQTALRVLATIKIENEATQFPINELEEERFVYFYRDSVTNLHNQKYLSILLLKNNYMHFYKAIYVISLHNFTAYNEHFGWEGGDKLLHSFGALLNEHFPKAVLFRIHANDFVLLSEGVLNFDETTLEHFSSLLQSYLTFSINYFDVIAHSINSMEELGNAINMTNLKRKEEKH